MWEDCITNPILVTNLPTSPRRKLKTGPQHPSRRAAARMFFSRSGFDTPITVDGIHVVDQRGRYYLQYLGKEASGDTG